jgi:hypothetical protein
MRRYYLLFKCFFFFTSFLIIFTINTTKLYAQGVTTAAMNGMVTDEKGESLVGANVVVVHEQSGTRYGAAVRDGGLFDILNMKIGGPYTVTVSFVGYRTYTEENIYLALGQTVRISVKMVEEALTTEAIEVVADQDEVMNAARTGAATYVNPDQVAQLPSIKRSTRDLTRMDPRSDGNFSFGGRNWLYNNISVDGSYFNNAFGLDDPAVGGQTAAEPIPFDAVEQVQVSVAPFDVREGGFTGANINTVTKSGTNTFRGSVYTFTRNEDLIGNQVRGVDVIASPDLAFNQSGFTVSGPIIHDKLFFFINGEIERRDDPGTNFVADRDGSVIVGESRVDFTTMERISQRMNDVYGYDTGPFEGFVHETNNDKLLIKLDWNINENHNLTFRYNYLDAKRELPPHPFVFTVAGAGRGPNESSLPFKNTGYAINNKLHSFALEINSRGSKFANRFFASYNRFRDNREPFSVDFPTIEIGKDGRTYTTIGHEPFSIHNILDQDVWQFINNFSYFSGKHVFTVGASFELYKFFNSFNIFRHGFPIEFESVDDFFAATDPSDPIDFIGMRGSGPFKGELFDIGQLSIYAQDDLLVSQNLSLTAGLRVDFPIYFTEPVDNPFVRALPLLDLDGNPEIVDQSSMPGAKPLFSPRVGFNWNASGDRSTQIRGGSGIFTGRLPLVWIGNNISNPGSNPNLFPAISEAESQKTSDDAILQQSFFINAMDPDFTWPQVWTTNVAIDKKLPWGLLGTLEFLYAKDINAVFLRNADLPPTNEVLPIDGRPFYTASTLSPLSFPPDGGAGVIVIDNTSEGYNYTFTAQLRKLFDFGLNTNLAYTFLQAKSQIKSTEIARSLWEENPVQGDPNNPILSYSEFGNRHRIVGGATYRFNWSPNVSTSFGLFVEVAEGNSFRGAGGNRYSFTYSGDVNGDGATGNDLIYIPNDKSEIIFDPITDPNTSAVISTPDQQWTDFNAFIEQDSYLSSHRGQIAERFGALNPWFSNIDFRVLQDFSFDLGSKRHTFQLSFDILNVANFLNSDWGVRKVASGAATIPLALTRFDATGAPVFNFVGPKETFIDDPGLYSRWRAQVGLRYFFN